MLDIPNYIDWFQMGGILVILIAIIPIIYWICLYMRVGNIASNQRAMIDQIDQMLKKQPLANENEIINELREENQKLRATIDQNSALLIEIRQAIENIKKEDQ